MTGLISLKRFSRKIEDFTCENCRTFNRGNGYTNHCVSCLYSKHVDINPGDRSSQCSGLMIPARLTLNKKKDLCLIHQCLKCAYEKSNKIADNDNPEIISKLRFF